MKLDVIKADNHDMISPAEKNDPVLNNNAIQQRLRWRALFITPLVIAFGLTCKVYTGPGFDLINNFGPASVAYVLLLTLLLFAARPAPQQIIHIAIAAFALTCVVEFSQLWHPAWLTQIRKTLPGRLILGTTFNVFDFPAYVIGAIVGFFTLKAISRPAQKTR